MKALFTTTRWEWFKLCRRTMPWVLLAIALLFSQLSIWAPYFSYRSQESRPVTLGNRFGMGSRFADVNAADINCDKVLAGDASGLPAGTDPSALPALLTACQGAKQARDVVLTELRGAFTAPGSVAIALSVAQGFGIILVAIMTASLVGSDYGWGTLRTVLVRGVGRWNYLATKLLLMLAGGLALMLLVALGGLVTGLIAGGLAGTSRSFLSFGFLGNAALDTGRAWFSLWPYIALATLGSLAARSSAAGMAAAIGYYFGEIILTAIFQGLFDWFHNVSDYLIVHNTTAWMQNLRLQETSESIRIGVGGAVFGEYPSLLHAFLVLAVYALALSALAFWLFNRRDVTAGGGG